MQKKVPWGWPEWALLIIGTPISLALCVLVMIGAALLGSTGAFAAGRIFNDDFESGTTTTKWAQEGSNTRCDAVNSAADGLAGAHTGSWMARCNWISDGNSSGTGTFTALARNGSTAEYGTEVLYRFWIRRDSSLNGGTGPKIFRLGHQESFGDLMLDNNPTGGSFEAAIFDANASTFCRYFGGDNAGDRAWHKIELYFLEHPSNGTVRMWVDDVMVKECTGMNTNIPGSSGFFSYTPSWTTFLMTSNWSAAPGCCAHDGTNYLYWDDFEIFSDTGTGLASGTLAAGTAVQGGGGGDTTAPTGVAITAPANAAVVRSSSVTVSASCTDETAIQGVQFLLDGANLGSQDTSSPFSIAWNTTTASNASHTLSARCTDTSSNPTTSSTISVTVDNAAPTGVAITAPTNAETISGNRAVSATCSDTVGVQSVQMLLDGANLGTADTTNPYSITWDTTTASNATHTLSARCTDTALPTGNQTTSATISVTVDNTDQILPTTPGTPVCNATSSTSIGITWTASTDASGIANYRLERCQHDACSPVTQIATPASNSYTDTVSQPTIYRYRVRAVDASTNANNSAYSAVGMCAAPAAPTAFGFGVNGANEVRNSYTAGERNQYWDVIVASGAQYVRQDVTHSGVEATQGLMVWTIFDTVIAEIRAKGLTPHILLIGSPGWNQPVGGNQNSPPVSMSAWTNFVTAAVTRYSAPPYNVTSWEVWNEPNLIGFWPPGPVSVVDYTTLLKATYSAIKAVSPNSTVMLNLSPFGDDLNANSATQWLTGIYANGGRHYFDAVSFHPYSWDYDPATVATWNATRQINETSPSLRSIMVANGDAYKQIWLTEFGGTNTGASGISEALQASRTVKQQIEIFDNYSFVGPVFYHTVRDPCTDTANIQCGFGLVRRDWSVKPAFYQLKVLNGTGLPGPSGFGRVPR